MVVQTAWDAELNGAMRVIGGKWRSRVLLRPSADTTRPLPDRVREAVFSLLGSHYECPGALPPLRVADVFAGSGAFGLEALSRGADSCVFFERSPAVLAVLRRNLASLQVGPEARIVPGNAWQAAVTASAETPFELLMLDPPYREAEDDSAGGRVLQFLQRLPDAVAAGAVVVLHHPRGTDFTRELAPGWGVLDQRRFGTNEVTVFERNAD